MALIDKASLLMVPSTYEEGTLYNVLPSGNRAPDSTDQNSGYDQTRADFTFDRGSNAAATRIGSDGLIKKYRENLLLQSNQFDTTWYNSNSAETGGQADKDGGTNAWLLTKTATNGGIRQNNTTTGVQTFSFYAKAADSNWVKVNNLGSSAYHQANFDLVNGVVGTTNYIIDAKIEDVGNGWFRCITTYNTTLVNIDVRVADSDNVVSGSSGSIYIQNAQLESGLVSSDYLDSGATTAKAGVLIDLPRINYDANGENGSLLLEPSRQQLIPFSEYFNASGWTKSSGVVITDNAAQSPEGLNNASYIQFGAASKLIAISTSLSTGVSCSSSCYIKGTAGETIKIAAGGVDSSLITLTGEWQRIENTATSINSSFNINTFGGATARNVYIFGAQLEAGSYVSSYIPNHSGTGGVTRAADSCFADNIGQTTAYTIFLDYGDLEQAESNFQDYISFQASGSNQNGLRAEGVGSAWRLYGYGTSGSVSFPINGSVSAKKKAIVVSTAGIKLFEDGALADEDLSGMTIPALGAITTKRGTSAPYPVEIKNSFKQIAVFNEALSNAECISLTS